MQANLASKRDQLLFCKKIAGWQEAYIGRLNREYIELLSRDGSEAEKFWELYRRIRRDKRNTGVQAEMRNSEILANLCRLVNEGVIGYDDLDGFSEELREDVIRITSYNAHETAIPKFSYDYDIEMSGALKSLGMTKPFDAAKADFSALGSSDSGNIFISRVLHKSYITVDEKGTKAGAATAADIKATSDIGGLYSVTLDRPFVYAVIDDAYGLLVFIGAVTDIGK